MQFRQSLQSVVESSEGAIACSIIGFDGIVLQTHPETVSGVDFSLTELWAEYAHVLNQVNRVSDSIRSGLISEMSIHAERLSTLMRRINPDYFLVVALRPEGNLGKARYLMRLAISSLQTQL